MVYHGGYPTPVFFSFLASSSDQSSISLSGGEDLDRSNTDPSIDGFSHPVVTIIYMDVCTSARADSGIHRDHPAVTIELCIISLAIGIR